MPIDGISRRQAIGTLAFGALAAAQPLLAAQRPESGSADHRTIDELSRSFMRAFEIPGLALAIVRPDQPPLLRTYGVRTLGQSMPIDTHTQFAIASNSKAFLASCLALLADEGRLSWEDPVVRHLPEFRMHDPAVTAMMTVRDLLVHRSGLPLGAGDLMQFPRTDHSREEILAALRHFKPAIGFRAGYAYDNILYIVAGMLLERVSGLGWDAFIANRIFQPLGMKDAVGNVTLARDGNRAGRHARLGPPTRGIGKVEVVPPREAALLGPAGGIQASISDMVPWLNVQLNKGALPNGSRLWSEEQAREMWTPQTITSSGPGPFPDAPDRAVISGYALGWGVADYRGRRALSHSGGLSGQITRTTLLPEQKIGLVVFTNSEESDAVSALRYALMDHLLEEGSRDWLALALKARADARAKVAAIVGDGDFKAPPGDPSLPLPAYAGRYRDPWYGDILITMKGTNLAIDFTRTPAFKSLLYPFGKDAFRTRFPRGAGEDAIVSFAVQDGLVTGISMKALSPIADFSYDFHHLEFTPVEG